MSDFLLEIFSEEIPARMQNDAREHTERFVVDALTKNEIAFEAVKSFVTPRRLVLALSGVQTAQSDRIEERRGVAVTAPEQALNGFLKSVGQTKDQLIVKDTPKGDFYFAHIEQKGRPTKEILKETIETLLSTFPWPKSMRWADHCERWVRPIHSMICLFGTQVIPVTFAGITAGNTTQGHRFLAPQTLTIKDFSEYQNLLKESFVIVDQKERRQSILDQANALAKQENLTVRPDEGLLDEVTGLVEYPVALIGQIDEEFMSVPAEVLITSMRSHQKYFSLLDAKGNFANRFIVIANIKTSDHGAKIIAGNERVLRARLSDARFFWEADKKEPLETKVKKLKTRVFHAKLGSVYDKTKRMRALVPDLLKHIPQATVTDADRACKLCKADLSTGMVGEFPELQGIMGRYYARHDGENQAVSEAIAQHYSPLGPNDACPVNATSIVVALADKIDTLMGFWLIDQKPTGSKDPFALRRAALGVIRLILENKIRLPIVQILHSSRATYGESIACSIREAMTQSEKKDHCVEPTVLTNWSSKQISSLVAFFGERLKVYLKDKGVRHDYITAVYNLAYTNDIVVIDFVRSICRVSALQAFLGTQDGGNLLIAYRRAANILRIEQAKGTDVCDQEADKNLFIQSEETALFDALGQVVLDSSSKSVQDDFEGAMEELAKLRTSVDAFFDNVTVNCDDVERRANRLRLLSGIVKAMGGVADFSAIEG